MAGDSEKNVLPRFFRVSREKLVAGDKNSAEGKIWERECIGLYLGSHVMREMKTKNSVLLLLTTGDI